MTAKHVGAGVANGAEQPSILGWERVGRERFGEIVEGKHSHSVAHRAPMANGQERMTCLREFLHWFVSWQT